MATGPRAVCRELKTLFHLGVVGTLSDAQLLDAFLARSGDAAEDAFAAVVERHGPMVLRVCRRILTEPHDAEDAFQVTFLVLGGRLVRSPVASSLPTGSMVSPSARRRRFGRAPPAGGLGRVGWTRWYAPRRRVRKTSTSCGS